MPSPFFMKNKNGIKNLRFLNFRSFVCHSQKNIGNAKYWADDVSAAGRWARSMTVLEFFSSSLFYKYLFSRRKASVLAVRDSASCLSSV